MAKKMNGVDWVAFVLVIIGALNWGLAIWNINLVAMLGMTWLINTIYALIGLSGIWLIVSAAKMK